MDIFFLIIGVLLHFFALPLLIIALIWFFFVARRLYREKKNLDAFKGNEAARTMTIDRIKAGLIRSLGIVLFPIVFVAVAFLLMDALGEAVAPIAFGAAVVVTGVCLFWSRSITKGYNVSFKENIVKAELTKVFDNLDYEPQGTFDQKTLQDLHFFSHFDRYGGNDLIAAEYEGLAFTQCDMRVEERYTVTVTDRDGDTHTEERWRNVFKGRGMRFDFADAFRGKVQVVSKDFDGAIVKQTSGEWQTVETELAEFGEYFTVYAEDPLDAMAVLTPQMIEGIFYLKKALDVPTALYFTGNSMFVFMALSREAFDVSSKNTLLEETKLLERDIALMTGFMDVMYFKRPAKMEEANRAETAAAVAAAAGPSGAEKVARQAARGLGMVFSFLPKLVIAVYLISAVYGFFNLPDEIVAGNSADAMMVPTIGFLLVSGVFIVIPALGGHFLFSAFCLALYLLFMSFNL